MSRRTGSDTAMKTKRTDRAELKRCVSSLFTPPLSCCPVGLITGTRPMQGSWSGSCWVGPPISLHFGGKKSRTFSVLVQENSPFSWREKLPPDGTHAFCSFLLLGLKTKSLFPFQQSIKTWCYASLVSPALMFLHSSALLCFRVPRE